MVIRIRRIRHQYCFQPICNEKTNFLDTVTAALNLKTPCAIKTGGNSFAAVRGQRDDGNNIMPLEPGVVIGYDRNTYTLLCKAGADVVNISVGELGRDRDFGMSGPIIRATIDY